MKPLHAAVTVRPPRVPAVNLERDATNSDALNGYLITTRATDVVTKVATAAAATRAGGAWSITGPYGSGKSSVGLLLHAAFGPAGALRRSALALIAAASPHAANLVERAHESHDTTSGGFARGLVTANREPLAVTLSRAITAAEPTPPPDTDTAAGVEAPASIIAAAKRIAQRTPLLIIVDEFGKNLEAARDDAASDPYLLQQLAEAGSGDGLPIFVVTLQHLSFGDYMTHATSARSEWVKVQGRFEDVAYIDTPGESRALIAATFDVADGALRERVARWSVREAAAFARLGVTEMSDPETVAACYPLSPLAAVALGEMCHRYGQHDRTLLSFLTGPGSATAANFVATTELTERGRPPTVGVDTIYDFFTSGRLTAAAPGRASRCAAIVTRLRDTTGLTPAQERLAKTIAVLNMISTGATTRASAALLARTEPRSAPLLAALTERGLITYRNFADEYRIWQGSDTDIAAVVAAHHDRAATRRGADLLNDVDPLAPQVAARHSAEHDTLRVFDRRYAHPSEMIMPPGVDSPYDGLLVIVIDDDAGPAQMPAVAGGQGPRPKPVVVAAPADTTELVAAARSVAATAAAVEDPTVAADAVALNELSERLAAGGEETLTARLRALAPGRCAWTLLTGATSRDLPGGRGSAALSDACARVYDETPLIGNEILNRHALTTQGAAARNRLLTAMVEHGDEADLALRGSGPEVAMYRSFLQRSGLHAAAPNGASLVFAKPAEAGLAAAWDAVVAQIRAATRHRVNLTDILDTLKRPPFGMREPPATVLVAAALVALRDDIAVYEHGTFTPAIAADTTERLARNPSHFEVKHYAHASGARSQILAALCDEAPPTVIGAVSELVAAVRRLDSYTLHTRRLPGPVRAVRDALLSATEPDVLIFDDLPEALNYPPGGAEHRNYPHAEEYAAQLRGALSDLTGALAALLGDIAEMILTRSGHTTREAFGAFASLLDGTIINPEVAAFAAAVRDTAASDDKWSAKVATVVARKSPAEWRDTDRERFESELPGRLAAFNRLVALHSERNARLSGPFTAMRVAFTRPDGEEYVGLLAANDEHTEQTSKIVDDAIRDLAAITGSETSAAHTLLTLAIAPLFATPTTTAAPAGSPTPAVAAAAQRPHRSR